MRKINSRILFHKMKIVSISVAFLIIVTACSDNGPKVVSIGLTKMNVLYRGVENPAIIAVSGAASKDIKATIDNGVMKQTESSYSINPTKLGSAIVTVTVNDKSVGTYEFRVKDLPDPTVRINGQSGGKIDTASIFKAGKLIAEIYNGEFQFPWTIMEFTMNCNYAGFSYDKISKSDKISPEQISLIKKLKPGMKIYFEDIRVMGPEGTPRTLGPIAFELK